MATEKEKATPNTSVPSTKDYVARNDKIAGLLTQVRLKGKSVKVKVAYSGRYGLGYDGCGTHTHK
jgi:hypothetical protein